MTLYVNSTNLVEITLKDNDDQLVTTATVTMRLLDMGLNEVVGDTVMVHQGSGVYTANIESSASIEDRRYYFVEINGTDSGRDLYQRCKHKAEIKACS